MKERPKKLEIPKKVRMKESPGTRKLKKDKKPEIKRRKETMNR